MSEPKSIPSEINSADTYKFGNLNITGLLKSGADYVIDGQSIASLAAPISFDSPIRCSSFSAELGTVSFFERAARKGWSPSNASEFLSSWYDPSDSSTLTGIGGVSATMTDKSGNNNTLTSTGGTQTNLGTGANTLNSLNVLDFGGDVYMKAGSANLASAGQISILAVAEIADAVNGNAAIFGVHGTNDFDFRSQQTAHFRGQAVSKNLGNIDGSNQRMRLTNVARNGPSIYEVYTDASDFGIVIDGSFPPEDGGNANPNSDYTDGSLSSSQEFFLFSRASSSYKQPKGRCGEVIILNTGGSAVRQACEGYLAHKWGLEGNLPSNHPYKASSPKV